MARFLIIGDSHIPQRAEYISNEIKAKIINLTENELFDSTLFTGDLTKCPELISFLKSRTKGLVLTVIGNMDYFNGNRDDPIYQEFNFEFADGSKICIGLTHGAQIESRGDVFQLELLALEKKYDILISGHTHKEEITLTEKGILLLNPGSVTGAWSFVASGNPCFMTLSTDMKAKEIQCILYKIDQETNNIVELDYNFIYESNQIHRISKM